MIYADNASSTKPCKAAVEAFNASLEYYFGNPSSPNRAGALSSRALSEARSKISDLLGAEDMKIIFTSGGSEANCQALATAEKIARETGRTRIVIGETEHDSVYFPAKELQKRGFDVVFARPDGKGVISAEEIARLADNNTAFVSVMTANNEIGTISPIEKIADICRERDIVFHTDAVQAAGHAELKIKKTGADLVSISAHKFGGIRGVGALIVREDITPAKIINGGMQENNYRAGTEPVPLICAMAAALDSALEDIAQKNRRLLRLRTRLEEEIMKIGGCTVNGFGAERLSGILSVSFEGLNSDALLIMLESDGICAAKGSACHSGSELPSRVMTAIGRSENQANGTLRFSLSFENTEREIEKIAHSVGKAVGLLRNRAR